MYEKVIGYTSINQKSSHLPLIFFPFPVKQKINAQYNFIHGNS